MDEERGTGRKDRKEFDIYQTKGTSNGIHFKHISVALTRVLVYVLLFEWRVKNGLFQ